MIPMDGLTTNVQRLQKRREGNTEVWYKGDLLEQQEKNIVKHEGKKKGYIKRKRKNIMKNNLNGYDSVILERKIEISTNKWIQWEEVFKAGP